MKDNDTPLIFATEQPTGFDHAWLYDEDDRMDDPVTLDTRRCVRARKDTEARRRRRTVADDMEAVRARQAMLERYLHGEAPRSWHELAEKARYLIEFLAATRGALDPQRQQLVADVLAELGEAARPASPRNDDPKSER